MSIKLTDHERTLLKLVVRSSPLVSSKLNPLAVSLVKKGCATWLKPKRAILTYLQPTDLGRQLCAEVTAPSPDPKEITQ